MTEKPVAIDIYYTEKCPHVTETKREIQHALEDLGLPNVDPSLREIRSDEEAREKGFTGSPTVFVNGRDVIGGATGEAPTADTCREYVGPDGEMLPYPTAAMLSRAIRDAQGRPGAPERV